MNCAAKSRNVCEGNDSTPDRSSQRRSNGDERGLHQDYEEWFEDSAPHARVHRYRHNRRGEDKGDAHLKRQIMGREVVVAVTDGSLDLGPWERIFQGQPERLARES